MKNIILTVFLFLSVLLYGQKSSDFKYVIVPERYENFKLPNQYQLSTFSKALFESAGYKVVIDNEVFPEDLGKDKCKALYPSLEIKSNMFMTKMIIVLKDCYNQEVFRSEEGICRKEKDNRISHQTAFREASKTLFVTNLSVGKPKNVSENYTEKSVEESSKSNNFNNDDFKQTLYAQETDNGFQLIDTTPKVIMKLTKTSSPDVYMANYKNTEGVLMNKQSKWVFEYSVEGQLHSHVLNIKF